MKGKWFIVFLAFAVLLAGSYLFSLKNDSKTYYTGAIDFNTTILGQKPTNEGLMLSIFDSAQSNVNKELIKYSNASKKDLITSIQSDKAYYLIQSNDSNVSDKILDVERKKIIDLGWRGHSLVAEKDSSILLAKYESDSWRLVLFDKSSQTLKDTGFHEEYADKSGVRVHHGMFSAESGMWYVPYSCQKGTFILFFQEEKFYREKVADDEISDLWMLNATNENLLFYSGYEGPTSASSTSLMLPKLYSYKIDNMNKLSEDKIINIDMKILGKGSNCLGYYPKSISEYLLIFKTEGEPRIRTVLLNEKSFSIKAISTTSPINAEAVKISSNILAVSSYDKAIFFENNGRVIFEKESNHR